MANRHLAFYLTMAMLVLSQVASPHQSSTNGRTIVDDPERFLRKHHVHVTEEGLLGALQNSDSGVRETAAAVLAKRWPEHGIPAVEQAIRRETVELVRVRMELYLARLGDQTAIEELRTECHNRGNWGSTREFAAESLVLLNDDACVDTITEIILLPSDPRDSYAKGAAIGFVPHLVARLEPKDQQKLNSSILNSLDDPAVSVRLSAVMTIGKLKLVESIPSLEVALTKETEATVKQEIEIALTGLKNTQSK